LGREVGRVDQCFLKHAILFEGYPIEGIDDASSILVFSFRGKLNKRQPTLPLD